MPWRTHYPIDPIAVERAHYRKLPLGVGMAKLIEAVYRHWPYHQRLGAGGNLAVKRRLLRIPDDAAQDGGREGHGQTPPMSPITGSPRHDVTTGDAR